MHPRTLGEGECPANKAGQSLAQRVIETLNVTGLPFIFAARPVMPLWDNRVMSAPQVGVSAPGPVAFGQSPPHYAKTLFFI